MYQFLYPDGSIAALTYQLIENTKTLLTLLYAHLGKINVFIVLKLWYLMFDLLLLLIVVLVDPPLAPISPDWDF